MSAKSQRIPMSTRTGRGLALECNRARSPECLHARPRGSIAGYPLVARFGAVEMATRVVSVLHKLTAGTLLLATAYFGTGLAYNMYTMHSLQKERQQAKEELMQSDVVRFSEGDLEKPAPAGSGGRSGGSEGAE